MKTIRYLLIGIALCGIAAAPALAHPGHDEGEREHVGRSFERMHISNEFYSEGATFADINQDGEMDIVSGPYWYAGPDFTERFEIYSPKTFDIERYSDNFFAFPYDINGNGWTDILFVGFPGQEAYWYENPQGKPGHWRRHLAFPAVDNESPAFEDVTGDGRPELVFCHGGQIGYAAIPSDDPTQPWKFQPVSPNVGYQRFTHGLGVGDLNGNGRADLLVKDGWWEHPATGADAELWKFHPMQFSEPGGAQMLVYDVNGNGRNDVVTSKAAHAYGLAWFENIAEGDAITFREHKIMGERPEENEYGVAFSQLHALALADIDGDGIPDVVTGKRFWAHGNKDPGSLDPAVLYWFQTVRDEGGARFIPHRIDANSGVGTQVTVGDVSGNGLNDVVVGNKKGTFVLLQQGGDVAGAPPEPAQASDRGSPLGEPTDGYPPKSADGRVLNLDFETGDLTDWTAEGKAFEDQPVKGDTIAARRGDSISGHKGDYWIGTYERFRDGAQGTLTSVSFPVTHPYASFLVGGGAGAALRVEIVRSDTEEVVFQAGGLNIEQMRPVVADLRELMGQEIFVRVVDRGTSGWGHINFDHFRFHNIPPKVDDWKPSIRKADEYPYAGLPADEAARVMELPDGFSVTVGAAEPDVRRPIAMAIDDRGRLWIAEAHEYPVRAADGEGRDQILIFEDTNGDGRLDSRKVFIEGLNLVSGLEVGFGGVWVGAAPYFMFIPDRDGDDVPDGEPEILLDGWGYQDTHETLNTFIWGPDGWLYGCHGVFTHSRVGKPGTPDEERIPLNAAIWRYHPTRHEFEVFAHGTSNPWGIDFDDHGQAFATTCVIPHLFHIIQGARYHRQAGSHFNPHTYADIPTIADHRHYVGSNPHAGNAHSGEVGGGHAHAGAMIYLGGAWPDKYRGRIFMNNIHGQRLNTDILKPHGSGYIGSHGPDFLLTGDIASQILNIRYGPDGNAYFIDWYDTNACHHNNPEGHDRDHGRIYKIVYRDTDWEPVDLGQHSDLELAEMTLHENDWHVRHARRILQERAAAGKLDATARDRLAEIAVSHPDATRQLRAMWALHVTGQLPSDVAGVILGSENEHVRAWAVRLIADSSGSIVAQWQLTLLGLATSDPSPVVRLAIASALQRAPLEYRWPILEALTRHAEDADDHNLPLMYWYAAEPLAEADPERALALALSSGKTIPLVRQYLLRRIGSLDSAAAMAALVGALGESRDTDEQLAIVQATRQALRGQRRVAAPANWPSVYRQLVKRGDERLRSEATALGVVFGDGAAMAAVREVVVSGEANSRARRDALQSLLAANDPRLAPTLHALLQDPAMRAAALQGLAQYDDSQTAQKVLAIYPQLLPAEKPVALAALAARPAYALELLRAVGAQQIPASDLTADLVRQLHNLKHDEVDELVAEVWGTVRSTPDEKAKLIAEYRKLIESPPRGVRPDMELGRAVYAKTCQQCHVLYGVGNDVGPDLTGSNRSDIDYLLSNIVDPSAVIAREYQSTVITTIDGRVVTGVVSAEDERSVTIRTATETLVIPQDEIDDRVLSNVSMMPDDQLKQFSDEETLSLFAYLRGRAQVPMLATEENAVTLFNGHDLEGWRGDTQLWSVEEGEIVGRSPGLTHNSFLISDLSAEDFRLAFEVKLIDDAGNSGVQFRSEAPDGFEEVNGYQADIGPGWWGKLYEENGRGLLWDAPGEEYVRRGEWNDYVIEARGSRIRTWINGQPCVDLDDPAGGRRGIFALQIHSGGPMEIRFRNLRLAVLDSDE